MRTRSVVLAALLALPSPAAATTVLSFSGEILNKDDVTARVLQPYYGGTFSGGLTFNEFQQPDRGVNYTAAISDFAVTLTSPDGSQDLTVSRGSDLAPSEVFYSYASGDGSLGLAVNIIAALHIPQTGGRLGTLRFALQIKRDCGADARIQTGLIDVRPDFQTAGLVQGLGTVGALPTLCGDDPGPGSGGTPPIGGGEGGPTPVPLPAGLPLLAAALGAIGMVRRRWR